MHETRIALHLEHKCGSDFNLSYIATIMSRRKYFYNLRIRVDGVCSLFLKLYIRQEMTKLKDADPGLLVRNTEKQVPRKTTAKCVNNVPS